MKKNKYEIRVYVGKELYELFKEFEAITGIQPSRALRIALNEPFFKEYLKEANHELKEFKEEYEFNDEK